MDFSKPVSRGWRKGSVREVHTVQAWKIPTAHVKPGVAACGCNSMFRRQTQADPLGCWPDAAANQ